MSNNIDVLRSHLVSFLTAGRVRRMRQVKSVAKHCKVFNLVLTQVTRNQEPLWHYLNRYPDHQKYLISLKLKNYVEYSILETNIARIANAVCRSYIICVIRRTRSVNDSLTGR